MTEEKTNPGTEAASTEAQKIAIQLVKEGGRGAVLLGAARLDLALDKLIKSLLHPHVGGDDNLFDSDRPLGTFSAKISLAYRLGLIDKAVEHALQMIRRVRNDFAHSFEDANLTEQAHRNRLSKPYNDARLGPMWPKIRPILASNSAIPTDLADFVCLVVALVSFMEAAAHMQEIIKPKIQVHLTHGFSN